MAWCWMAATPCHHAGAVLTKVWLSFSSKGKNQSIAQVLFQMFLILKWWSGITVMTVAGEALSFLKRSFHTVLVQTSWHIVKWLNTDMNWPSVIHSNVVLITKHWKLMHICAIQTRSIDERAEKNPIRALMGVAWSSITINTKTKHYFWWWRRFTFSNSTIHNETYSCVCRHLNDSS